MHSIRRKEPILLFGGDLLAFALSLWLALLVRYGSLPSRALYVSHVRAFSLIFLVSALVFFIGGLYEKRNIISTRKIATLLFKAEMVNVLVAVALFYFIPFFGISPKTNLFLYLVFSFGITFLWRYYESRGGSSKKEQAMLVGSGDEVKTLLKEINANARYGIEFASWLDLDSVPKLDFTALVEEIKMKGITALIIDLEHPKVGAEVEKIYRLLFSRVDLGTLHDLYENVFDRIPLSLVRHSWFLENISLRQTFGYDALKRFMDVILGLILGILSLVLYPFVWLAIKFDDGGAIFIRQERTGQNGEKIRIVKFRTMVRNDEGDYSGAIPNKVTKVGKILRTSRVDEVPQFWNIVLGDLSFVGPRPELPSLVKEYQEHIPYYNVRHLIKPGLSGWAQIYHEEHPHHMTDIAETKNKLSYDLYYVKNRSFFLDLKIALRTVQTLLSRSGK